MPKYRSLLSKNKDFNYPYILTGKTKFVLRVSSLMSEQSEGNNHTRKINVFFVLHTIFFLLGGQQMDLFAPHRTIKSTL